MPIILEQRDAEEVLASVQRFFRTELEQPLTALQARQVVAYVLKEIAPFAYNRGVKDAEAAMRRSLEDLAANCFEEELGWSAEKRRQQARS